MENLKSIERDERVNRAKRNLILAESIFEDAKRDYEELEALKEEYQHDVHFGASLSQKKRKMSRAYDEVLSAKKAVLEADIDPSVLEKATELITRGLI